MSTKQTARVDDLNVYTMKVWHLSRDPATDPGYNGCIAAAGDPWEEDDIDSFIDFIDEVYGLTGDDEAVAAFYDLMQEQGLVIISRDQQDKLLDSKQWTVSWDISKLPVIRHAVQHIADTALPNGGMTRFGYIDDDSAEVCVSRINLVLDILTAYSKQWVG